MRGARYDVDSGRFNFDWKNGRSIQELASAGYKPESDAVSGISTDCVYDSFTEDSASSEEKTVNRPAPEVNTNQKPDVPSPNFFMVLRTIVTHSTSKRETANHPF